MRNIRSKTLAVLAGLAVTGIASAAAAGLGGLDVGTLGAENEVVASCQTSGAITVDFTTSYDSSLPGYVVGAVELGNVDAACDGKSLDLTLSDADDEVLFDTSSTAAEGTTTVNIASTVSAESVEGISIVISG